MATTSLKKKKRLTAYIIGTNWSWIIEKPTNLKYYLLLAENIIEKKNKTLLPQISQDS